MTRLYVFVRPATTIALLGTSEDNARADIAHLGMDWLLHSIQPKENIAHYRIPC